MTIIPSLPYDHVVRALQRDGWIVVRQKGSHIRLQKHTATETLKLTIPAHRPPTSGPRLLRDKRETCLLRRTTGCPLDLTTLILLFYFITTGSVAAIKHQLHPLVGQRFSFILVLCQ